MEKVLTLPKYNVFQVELVGMRYKLEKTLDQLYFPKYFEHLGTSAGKYTRSTLWERGMKGSVTKSFVGVSGISVTEEKDSSV